MAQGLKPRRALVGGDPIDTRARTREMCIACASRVNGEAAAAALFPPESEGNGYLPGLLPPDHILLQQFADHRLVGAITVSLADIENLVIGLAEAANVLENGVSADVVQADDEDDE